MPRLLLAALAALLALPAAAATPTTGASTSLDLETIMADADWMGQPVESPYWSVDGRGIYYELKRDGSSVRDLYRADPSSGRSVKLDPAAMAGADGPAVFDRAHRHAAFVLHGDIFLVDLATGQRRQVTLTTQRESSPQFSADGRALQYRAGNDWFTYDLAKGISAPVAELKFADDPQAKQPDDLGQLQLDLFKTLRAIKADKTAVRERTQALEAADAGRAPQPFWLGDKIKLVNSALSPNGRWLLLVTEPKGYKDGKASVVNHYVTDSGYTEAEERAQLCRPRRPGAAIAAAAGPDAAPVVPVEDRRAARHHHRPAGRLAQADHGRAGAGRQGRPGQGAEGAERAPGHRELRRYRVERGRSERGRAVARDRQQGSLDRQRRFRAPRAGQPAAADRSGVDQLELQ
ncbi:hypothetical protein [Rhodanobacter lindaniclasticus]